MMQHSLFQLMDLPDELLLNIFNELGNVLALFSFMNINKRLDNILQDSIFTNHLIFFEHPSNDCIDPLSDQTLNQFCLHILPKIHNKVKWFSLESSSMKRIFLAADYSNLSRLSLYDVDEEIVKYFFTDRRYKNQISNLSISFNKNKTRELIEYAMITAYSQILTEFTNLHYLNFCSSSNLYDCRLTFEGILLTFISSPLIELHICLKNFNDCLYLLDGRLNQLRILYVTITFIFPPSSTIENKNDLPNLKCFSLICDIEMCFYDELIVPLLHRMRNLENLGLYISSGVLDRFIDGNNLQMNIVDYMPELNEFLFNIRSTIILQNQVNFPSNDDIQHTFLCFPSNKIISCVDYFLKKKTGQCHIYSYPYRLTYYNGISNQFSNGLFRCVREISLFDEQSFEYDFFLRISYDFPLLKKLSLSNQKCQKFKEYQKSMINYSHLMELELTDVHKDYVELFLDHTKICLSNKISLHIDYRPLRKATYNFKRDALRINSSKTQYLWIYGNFKMSQCFKHYFPHVKKFSFSS